jgi:hypothetical protein
MIRTIELVSEKGSVYKKGKENLSISRCINIKMKDDISQLTNKNINVRE